ncbi:MAG: PadR family transcriptional regulator [Promethearchaeota archaeon]
MRIPELTQAEVAILSLLSEGAAHGYALNEAIEYRGMRSWTDIAFSSIYAILNRLEKEALITSRLDPSAKGPARKIYRLTRKGRTTLLKTIRLYISEPESPKSRINLGAAYIELLPTEDAIQCLEGYRTKLQERMDHIQKVRAQQQPVPFGADIIFDHGLIKGHAELEWIDDVLKQLRKRQENQQDE